MPLSRAIVKWKTEGIPSMMRMVFHKMSTTNLESMSNEKSDDKKEFLRQNGLLSLNDHNKVNESLHKGEEEVVGSKEGNNVTKGETGTMCR
ncbi:hypothetical protein HYC85_028558 [Camellia sinensis]|uniref:Uncharacterized protein n=1 Tax=Camellia sinensis TaxID=4442 RepID=A0A7J7FW87_CAMSI|nr:hypothetical protein HYC85_028558 [Camellia sinensis]